MQSEDVDNTMGMWMESVVENDFMNDLLNVMNDSSDSSSGQIQSRQRTHEIVRDGSKFSNESTDDVKKALNEIMFAMKPSQSLFNEESKEIFIQNQKSETKNKTDFLHDFSEDNVSSK